MQTYILDSSVIIKRINIKEEDYEIARNIFNDLKLNNIKVIVPTYWKSEIINFISRVYEAEQAFFTFKTLEKYNFEEKDFDDDLVRKTIEIVKNCDKIASYDATFHALAIIENATLITADERYYKAAKKFGHIILLKDYK